MSKKTKRTKDGQINKYIFYQGGDHEHLWYDPKSGKMGYHAEKASKDLKKIAGHATKGINGVTKESYRTVLSESPTDYDSRKRIPPPPVSGVCSIRLSADDKESTNNHLELPLRLPTNDEDKESKKIYLGRNDKMSIYSARKKSRVLDRTVIQSEANDHARKIEQFHELGEKFKEDKEKWEEAYDAIESDNTMDRKEKIAQLRALKNEIEETQKKYEEQVVRLEEEEFQELQGNIEEMQELADKLGAQAERLEGMKKITDSSGTDAAKEARDSSDKANQWAISQAELLQSKVEHFKRQAEKMRTNRH